VAGRKKSKHTDGNTAGLAQRLDVAHRRLTEQTAVFAIELACTLITDFKSCRRGVNTIHEHPLAENG